MDKETKTSKRKPRATKKRTQVRRANGTNGANGAHKYKAAGVRKAANHLLKEGRKMANELFEDGLGRIDEVEVNVKEYSDHLVKKVRNNPLASVLIAGGVGFLVSRLIGR